MSAGRHVNTKSQSWGTPQKYVSAVKVFFGGAIDLDPCSNEYSIVNAKTEFLLPEHDGLVERWDYPTIYVNPPYGFNHVDGTSIKDWLRKCADANIQYGSEVLALVPVATNTAHWKRFVFTKAAGVCFLGDTRLRFLEDGKDSGKGAPMACAMVYWGADIERFKVQFSKFGPVVDITEMIVRGDAAVQPSLFEVNRASA